MRKTEKVKTHHCRFKIDRKITPSKHQIHTYVQSQIRRCRLNTSPFSHCEIIYRVSIDRVFQITTRFIYYTHIHTYYTLNKTIMHCERHNNTSRRYIGLR